MNKKWFVVAGLLALIVYLYYDYSTIEWKSEEEEEIQVPITQDSLKKLRTYIHDTILINAQSKILSGTTISIKRTYIKMYETDTNNLQYTMDLAKVLIASTDAKEAIHFFDVILAKDKNYASEVYFQKNLAWSMLLNRDSSLFYLQKAIDADIPHVRYIVYRSQRYEEDSLFTKAIDDINWAIKIQPTNKGLYVFRGIYKGRLGKYKEAIIDMKEVPTYLQRDANVYAHRAYYYMQLKRYKECIEDADKSILLNPNNGHEYGVRANAKSNLGDFEGAYSDLKKAVKLGNKEAIQLLKEYKKYFDENKQI